MALDAGVRAKAETGACFVALGTAEEERCKAESVRTVVARLQLQTLQLRQQSRAPGLITPSPLGGGGGVRPRQAGGGELGAWLVLSFGSDGARSLLLSLLVIALQIPG